MVNFSSKKRKDNSPLHNSFKNEGSSQKLRVLFCGSYYRSMADKVHSNKERTYRLAVPVNIAQSKIVFLQYIEMYKDLF